MFPAVEHGFSRLNSRTTFESCASTEMLVVATTAAMVVNAKARKRITSGYFFPQANIQFVSCRLETHRSACYAVCKACRRDFLLGKVWEFLRRLDHIISDLLDPVL